jgi:predicted permease
MSAFSQDLRFALRGLARSPGFALVAVATLALGIGANTAIFSVVDATVLRPLPYGDPGALVDVQFARSDTHGAASIPDYRDLRDQARSLSELAGYHGDSAIMTGGPRPVQLGGIAASANIFRTLGVVPALGRGFADGEDTEGRNRVAVLSDAAWRRHLGADPAAVGRTITLDGAPHTIIGVMAPGFHFVGPFGDPEVWLPMPRGGDPGLGGQRGARYLFMVGRLAPGATVEQAGAELAAINARLALAYPGRNAGSTVRALPLQESAVAGFRPALLVLLGAVGFVLLIACANVANLLLARATVRQREIAVRVALGAGRGRIVRQLLTESLVLAILGGALGVLAAIWGLDALRSLLPEPLARLHAIAVDGRVLAFTLVVCLATGVAFGILPALHAASANPADALASAHASAGADRLRLRNVLAAAEVAAALLLLVGAGLMLRSFWRLNAVDPGFDPRDVTVARLALPDTRYASDEQLATMSRGLRERLAALPGVTASGLIIGAPFGGADISLTFKIVGAPPQPPGQQRVAAFNGATAGAFAALRIPLLAGRLFTDAEDRPDGPLVAVVSEAFVRRHFPSGDALGRKITMWWRGNNAPREIIGVVGDIRGKSLEQEPVPVMYFPLAQAPSTFFAVAVRTRATAGLADSLRAAVAEIDPDQPIADVVPLGDMVRDASAQRRLSTWLLGIFGAVALVLALVGVYGVMAYSVAQREHEIGIRLALGAGPSDVTRMVVRRGAGVALAGIAAGVALTLPLARLLRGLLYGVGATDPATYAAIAAGLFAVAALASWLPARRAARVDPTVALRAE